MQGQDKQFKTVFLILSLAGILASMLYFQNFQQHDSVQIKNFPQTIGDWTSEEIPISKNDLAILETDNAFVRKYTNPLGKEVLLYIVYSQTNRKVSHPPEICYTGGGIQILEKNIDSIDVKNGGLSIEANQLIIQAPQLDQVAYYWFKEGDSFIAQYWKQQIMVVMNTVLGKRKGSALIRVSADIINKDRQAAISNVKEFVNLITPDLYKYLP